MPIVKQVTSASVLVGMHIDMVAMEGRAVIRQVIDGETARETEYLVSGVDFATLLQTPGVATQTLGDQVTDAIYNYLITKGIITGTVA